MPLRVHDTRRREKVEFVTQSPGRVSMYVCGVTVYDNCHLGHARCYIAFDLIHRWLEASGYDVDYVQNFTDIDDKIIIRSIESGEDWRDIVDRNIKTYYEDMDTLNILRADHYPRCTEYVESMIHIIEDLIEKEHAYVADDGVYFHVDSAPEKYGQLTGQSIDAVRQGAGGRVNETGGGKRDHKDFALWKQAKPGEPTWPSPWGDGRPGWHIECSAMSLDHFGTSFDIHGGGHDLRFPHHEAEIFQSECHTGHAPLAGYWLHNGFVNIDGEKMSKSDGNFWTVRDALVSIDPLALRYALINAPYRQPVDFNAVMIEDSTTHYHRLISSYSEALHISHGEHSSYHDIESLAHSSERVTNGMNDDFNTRTALVEIQTVVKELSSLLQSKARESKVIGGYVSWLEEFAGEVLGILPPRKEALEFYGRKLSRRSEIEPEVSKLLEMRENARASKDWSESDRIRDELNEMGVTVEDSPEGTKWRII